jgi:hypothetical protein
LPPGSAAAITGGMNISLHLPRELVAKVRQKKNQKRGCPGVLDLVALHSVMPSQRAADKDTLSFYVPRTLKRRLQKLAKMLGSTLTDIVVMILAKETNRIELTAEDYEQIAAETRAAERQNPARSKAKAEDKGKA